TSSTAITPAAHTRLPVIGSLPCRPSCPSPSNFTLAGQSKSTRNGRNGVTLLRRPGDGHTCGGAGDALMGLHASPERPACGLHRWSAPMSVPVDPALRAAFAAESEALGWQATRIACLLTVTLVPLFAILDAVVFPGQVTLFLVLRIGCVTIVGLIGGALHTGFGRRHARELGVLVTVTVGLMIDGVTMVTGAETSPYYAGTNLVLLAVALLMPWPPTWAFGTALLLLGGYVAPIVSVGRVSDARMLVNNLFFLSSTALVTVVSTAMRERLRWREFANRAALVEALRHK